MKSSRSPTNKSSPAWILVDDGHPSLENQALAIVEAMDLPTKLYRLSEDWYWSYVPTWIGPNPLARVHASPRALTAPWPSFVICGGSVAVKIGQYLKNKHNTYIVALGDVPSSFDKMILEGTESDEMGKTIVTCGPLHRIHAEHVREARVNIYRKIDHLPKPRIGLFLEGEENVEDLTNLLANLYTKSPFSLMVYGKDLSKTNQQKLKEIDIPKVLWFGESSDPYLGFLAHSDGIIVNSTSPLMMVEASSTGKLVSVYLSRPFDAFTKALVDRGFASVLSEASLLVSKHDIASLQETERVAKILKDAIPPK